MKILVDTSIWSLALRRRSDCFNEQETSELNELIELINESRANIIGPIRQELLSGIQKESQFTLLKAKLEAFEDLPLETRDYELAASFFNHYRKKGIQGSHIDFLICAVAYNNNIPIFTRDKDFILYSPHCQVRLYHPMNR